MNYKLSFRESFVVTDLPQLPRHIQKRLENINAELRQDPTRQGGNIKKLKGFEYLWRYRVGDYRIIYAVVDGYVEFLSATFIVNRFTVIQSRLWPRCFTFLSFSQSSTTQNATKKNTLTP